MQYHIQTDPIWEAFRGECDCPLCEIYRTCENRLVEQYLDEAVMEPEYRVQVNTYGFCHTHLGKLYAGKNKLGLSLQLRTRLGEVRTALRPCQSAKQAQKQAATLHKTMDTCVICRSLDEMLERYAYTVAQMYACEQEFRTVFARSSGFCMPHYALLLQYASKAGGRVKSYLSDLVLVQNRSVDRTLHELDRFAACFDYRSAAGGSRPDPETVPRAMKKLKGYLLP